jgi:type I restriction enzyme S subunit
MIANLHPYPEYKESGLPWVGRMPAHWSQRRMKFLFRERVQKGFPNEPLLAATQTKGVVRKEDYGERTVTVTKDFHLLKLVETGDFVISLRSFEGGIEVAHYRGIISPAYTVLAPRPEVRGSYYTRFFKSPDFIRSLTLFVTGIREGQNIDYERLSRAYMPLPPADEQDLTGRFLDYANGRLERAIRAKRKVIALLHEQKQAIIHRAVTRGLDPTVPLKPSGIPWLGDIPQHWEMIPARHLFRAVTRRDIQGDEPKMSVTQKHGLVPTSEMQENSTQAQSFDRFQLCHPDDLVLNKYKAHLGVFWAATRRGLITPNYTVFRPARKLSTKFFEYLFHTQVYRDAFSMVVYGVIEGMCPLYTQDFYRIPCAFPPCEEQIQIVDALVNMTKPEDTAINRLEREIELLREYRTRLVADVVTGKLDVRPAARHLPAESLAPEPAPDPEELAEPETEETA